MTAKTLGGLMTYQMLQIKKTIKNMFGNIPELVQMVKKILMQYVHIKEDMILKNECM